MRVSVTRAPQLLSLLSLLSLLWLALALALIACGCNVESPPRGPEDTCAQACATRATGCTRPQCARGCNLVLDRLVEHEGERVIACVADSRSETTCDDRRWAHCAALVGPHADGGPPPPARANGFEDEE